MNPAAHVAIVGADSLAGRELGQVLRARRFPLPARLYAAEPAAAPGEKRLLEFAAEAQWLETAAAESLAAAKLVFFAAHPGRALELYTGLPAGARVVDLTGGLQEIPGASFVRAASLASRALTQPLDPGPWLVANAAAQLLGEILERLAQSVRLERAAAWLLEPVSQHGSAGIEELHQQARALLNAQAPPAQILGRQLAFNVWPAPAAAADSLLQQLAALRDAAEAAFPLPALQLLRAPLFHGYLLSLWFQTAQPADPVALSRWLGSGPEPPDALRVGEAEAAPLGPVRADPAGGCWLQAGVDNVRGPAQEAVRLAELALAERGA
jgi:aspartate-semialdehyde dehydrogenase